MVTVIELAVVPELRTATGTKLEEPEGVPSRRIFALLPSPFQFRVYCCPELIPLYALFENWTAEARRGIRVVATRATNLAEKCILDD